MTRQALKLLQRERRSKNGWKTREIRSLYEGFGFIIRGGRGSELIVSHPDVKFLRATVASHPKELAPN